MIRLLFFAVVLSVINSRHGIGIALGNIEDSKELLVSASARVLTRRVDIQISLAVVATGTTAEVNPEGETFPHVAVTPASSSSSDDGLSQPASPWNASDLVVYPEQYEICIMARRYDIFPACYAIMNATAFVPLFLPPGNHVLSFGARRKLPLGDNPIADYNDPKTWMGLKETSIDIFTSDLDWSHGPEGHNSLFLDLCDSNDGFLAACHGNELEMAMVSFNTEDYYGRKRRSGQHGKLAVCTGRVAARWVDPQEDAVSMAAHVAVW